MSNVTLIITQAPKAPGAERRVPASDPQVGGAALCQAQPRVRLPQRLPAPRLPAPQQGDRPRPVRRRVRVRAVGRARECGGEVGGVWVCYACFGALLKKKCFRRLF